MSPLHATPRTQATALSVFALASALFGAALVAPAAGRKASKAATDWKAPARAARKKNPVEPAKASFDVGRKIYAAECADCHGPRGAGDGPGARELKDPIPSLADARVWTQSDGELFWKLSTGRGDMPGFDDMLEDEDRWHVLNYARATFGKNAQARAADGGAAHATARRGKAE